MAIDALTASATSSVPVALYETQVAVLERIVASGQYGSELSAVLTKLLREHVKQRLDGRGSVYVSGLARDDVLVARTPEYGSARLDVTLEPVTGKAIPVNKGEVLRIEQVDGGQCVDFNAFNMKDYKETLDCGFTRSNQSFDPRRGEFIWTNAPRGRPMFAILADGRRVASRHRRASVQPDGQERSWGLVDHPNCQDTFAEAIREYGLTPDDVHDSFNLWFSTRSTIPAAFGSSGIQRNLAMRSSFLHCSTS